jgi:hypothetical protein
MTHEIDTIPLDAVNIKGGTQSRVELNQATIAEYVELIRASVELPPVITFFDGSTFWLADGFHRFNAHLDAGATEIASEVRTGTQRDAILLSVGANAAHGLRRTNEDKRRAVMTLLNDPEWSTWSSEAIAKACAVSPRTVSAMRISANAEIAPVRTVERNGKTYEQNTANIGKPAPAAVVPSAANPLDDDPAPFIQPANAPLPAATTTSPDEVVALREQLAEISDALKSTLDDNEMMGRVFDADDKLKAAMGEAKRQKAIADNAERTLAAKTGEFVARAAQVTHWMNRAQKAEKALAKLGVPK